MYKYRIRFTPTLNKAKAIALAVTCPKCQKNGHTLENCWRDGVCDVCGNTGHIAEVCSQRPKDGTPTTKSVSFEKYHKVDVMFCYYCPFLPCNVSFVPIRVWSAEGLWELYILVSFIVE
jgi:hypothetical protein